MKKKRIRRIGVDLAILLRSRYTEKCKPAKGYKRIKYNFRKES